MKQLYLRNLVAVLMLLFITNLTFGRIVKEKENHLNESPVITVADITAFTGNDRCSAVVNNYGASASATSGIKSLSFNIAEGSVFSTGVTEVTARAEDNAGNVSFATFNVTVVDNLAPEFLSRESFIIFLDDNGVARVTPDDLNPDTIKDNCGVESITFDRTSFDCTEVGFHVINVTATDASGNVTTGQADVEVRDEIAPEFLTRESFILQLDQNGVARISPDDFNRETISSNCDIVNLTIDRTEFNCNDVGFHVINVTATDRNGLSTTGQADVEVRDEIAPEFLTRESFILQLDQNGVARISPDDFNRETISSNCDIVNLTIDRTEFNCNDVGFHVINVTATDRNGLSTTGQADVEVRDEIAPEFLTRESFILQLDQNGVARISPDDFNRETISSNCDIVSLTIDRTEFNCNDVGFHVINVTATDRNGLSTTGQADVEVRDEIAPEFLTRESFILQLDQNGVARISPDDFNRETISSNCDIVSLTIDRTEFNCNDVGFHVINVTATDRNGLSTTGQADVEVRDEIAPEFLTRESFILQLDQNGVARISPDDFNRETISSNCDIVGLTIDRTEFNCNDVGFHVINVTATDRNGLSTTGQADVEVRDEIFPEFLTRESFILQLDQNGVARISPGDFNRETISSNCDIVSLTIDRTEFNCNDVGFHVINVTATDRNGLSTTGQADVEVRDEIAPEFLTRESFILQLDQNGVARISPDDFNRETISSNCDIVSLTIDRTEFNCNDVGFHVINVTATDRNGLSTTGQADVEVRDEIAPEFLTRESFILQLDQNGVVRISPDDFNRETISSNCDIVSLTIDRTEFNCNDVGFHVINVTATDRNGLSTTGQADVEVRDEIAPEFLTRESFILQLDQNGVVRISPDDFNRETISSNCDIVSLTIDRTEFNCNDVGFHVINVTATDRNGLSTTGQADVEVRDEIAPEFLTRESFILQLDQNGVARISPDDFNRETISSNCDIVSFTIDRTEFNCNDVGFHVINVTATDRNGLSTTGQADVEVRDEIAPEFLTRESFILQLDQNGVARISPDDFNRETISSNCDIVSLTIDRTEFNCNDVGFHVVNVTATDRNGLSTSGQADVEVRDEIAPEFLTRESFILQLDQNGVARISPDDFNRETISSNCDIVSLTIDRTEFNCNDVGFHVINVTATDRNGLSTTGQADVEVRDEIAPTVVTKNIIVELDSNGSATISPADVDGGTFDNCTFTLSLNMEQFGCADLGNNIVQLTAHDQNGVFASASATVTVVDRIAPRAIARNITVRLGDDGRATVDPRVVGGRSTDNCGIVSYKLSKDTFTCKDIRRNGNRRFGRGQPVVLTVTDAAGNSSRAIAYINVVDRRRPEISDEPITLVVSSRRNAYLLRRDVLKAVSDNCGIRTVGFQRRTFTTRNTGINLVRVVATDHSGNVTRGFVKVKVVNRDSFGSIVNMCFKGRSIKVSKQQVSLWLRRGASFGSCSNISSQPGGLEVQEEVQVESDINVVPEISLKSYPNPTSGYTVINFRSDVAGPAKVTVMNTKGVTMAVVFDKEVEAHQEVEVGYETGKLSNGVYLIRLVTAGEYRTIRLIVRK